LCALFRRIVQNGGAGGDRGLPIGSLTSQHLANFYLGWFDRFVKERLRVSGYVRYMDDCVLWAAERASLTVWIRECNDYLRRELDLEAQVRSIGPVWRGLDFLGCRVYPDHLKLNRRSRRRFRRKLLDLELEFECGDMEPLELQQRLTSLVAFTRAGGTRSWKFRRGVLQRFAVSGHWASTA
jgi:hypothetical protein